MGITTTEEHLRWLREFLWADGQSDVGTQFRLIHQPIGQQFRAMSVSQFDPNIVLYERLLRRATEHGFLLFFVERNSRVRYPLYLARMKEIMQTDGVDGGGSERMVYNAMRLDDLQMAFATLVSMWAVCVVVFLCELLVAGFSTTIVAKSDEIRKWIVGLVVRKQ